MGGATRGLAAHVQLACRAGPPAGDLAAAAAEAQYTVLRDMQCGRKEGPSFKGKHSLVASDPKACEAECTSQGAVCNGFLWAPTGGLGTPVPAGGSCFFHSDVSQPTPFPGHHCYVRRGGQLAAPPLDSVRLSVLNASTGQALAPTRFGDIELVAGQSLSLVLALSEPVPQLSRVRLELAPSGEQEGEVRGACELSPLPLPGAAERADRVSRGGTLLEMGLLRFEARRGFGLRCNASAHQAVRLSAKLGCSYVSTWHSPLPLTVVEQGRLAIELSDGSGQGASALVVGTAYRAVLRLPAPSLQPTRFVASIAHSGSRCTLGPDAPAGTPPLAPPPSAEGAGGAAERGAERGAEGGAAPAGSLELSVPDGASSASFTIACSEAGTTLLSVRQAEGRNLYTTWLGFGLATPKPEPYP